MFDRFRSLFADRSASPEDSPDRGDPSGSRGPSRTERGTLAFAAASLLMEAARSDDAIDAAERTRILHVVQRHFGLDAASAQSLARHVETETAGTAHHYDYIKVIVDRCPPEDRIEMIEMLWEVVYADGELHPLEASLLRRIGGLLYVSDVDRGSARKRVLRRLGLPDDAGLP